MTSTPCTRFVVVAALVVLLGAGCPSPVPQKTSSQGQRVPSELGFGKLPQPRAQGQLGSPEAISSAPQQAKPTMAAGRLAIDAVAPNAMMGSQGGVASAGSAVPVIANTTTIARPVPAPLPRPTPVSVEYSILAPLPEWKLDDNVLRVERTLPDARAAGNIALGAGLPAQALSPQSTISSINIQWRDAEKFQWTFDTGSRMVSFWRDAYANEQRPQTPPSLDEKEIVGIADRFLNAHGFSAIAQTGGTVEEQQVWIMKGGAAVEGAVDRPCPMMESGAAVTTIYPSPCPWWPQQVNVYYGTTFEGRTQVDQSGYPIRVHTVTVDLGTKHVLGGNIQLTQSIQRSSYPMISEESARKRLQSGGLNPVYPWGNESSTIKVFIKKIDFAWLRYDSWDQNENQTYILPALLATGTVNRNIEGQAPEEYRTVIPLVDDTAFAELLPSPPPFPVPMPLPAETAPPSAAR